MLSAYPDLRGTTATGRPTAAIDRPYGPKEPMFARYEPPQRSCRGCRARGERCQLMGRRCASLLH